MAELMDQDLSDDAQYQALLRKRLMDKMQQQERGMEADTVLGREAAKTTSGLGQDLGMIDILNRSAAQAGTLSGKSADASPVTDNTKRLIQGRSVEDESLYQSNQDRNKLNQYLMGKMLDQEGAIGKARQEREKMTAEEASEKADRDFKAAEAKKDRDAKAAQDAANKPDKLEPEDKAIITGLSQKNASKASIANQMQGYLEQFRNAKTDDAKLVIGRQMLKVLNSPEGADAIGVEEANRLGSLLEYKIGNFTGPGSFIGRDMDLFDEQVVGTINSVKKGIELNNQMIADVKAGRGLNLSPTDSLPKKQADGTATAAPKKSAIGPGKIRVTNGKETLIINMADMEDALKDGYREVK